MTRQLNGKERQVLTSMADPRRFPGAEFVELNLHRWEIELGYREMKHHLQQHRLTKPEGGRGLVLAYDLCIRRRAARAVRPAN